MPFAVLVVGSPGAGKSTFCQGMQQLYKQLHRRCVIVNLDPANDDLPYDCHFDVRSLVDFERVCEEEGRGPNGAFLRCMEIVEEKVGSVIDALSKVDQSSIFFFDCPGQVELYSMHDSLSNIVKEMSAFSFAVANILDSTQMHDFNSFLAITMVTLNSMLHLELPQVNFLNKFDLVTDLPSPLDLYCAADLRALLDDDNNVRNVGCNRSSDRKRVNNDKLTSAIVELIDEHSLVSFVPLAVEDKDSMLFAMGELDRISGYVFGALSAGNDSLTEAAFSASHFPHYLTVIQERYLNRQHLHLTGHRENK